MQCRRHTHRHALAGLMRSRALDAQWHEGCIALGLQLQQRAVAEPLHLQQRQMQRVERTGISIEQVFGPDTEVHPRSAYVTS